jgi:hypothetical protein
MIVSVPLNLPRLEPDNWDKWWHIWNNNAAPLNKIKKTINKIEIAPHLGFDAYRAPYFDPVYTANYVDFKTVYPMMYDQIMSFPVKLYCARFLMATDEFEPHTDYSFPNWSIRSMFYCKDPNPQWYYTDLNKEDPKYLSLPETTNWWAYRDGVINHASHFRKEYPKIILLIFANQSNLDKFAESQINIFPDHQIEYDIS